RVKCLHAASEQLRHLRQLFHRRDRHSGLVQVGSRSAARDELPSELCEPGRQPVEPLLVPDRDQRAHSSLTTSGRMRCSTACTRRRRLSAVSPSSTGTVSLAITGPVSTPSSTKKTVAAVSLTPAASASSTGCIPGKSGSRPACVLTIRPANRSMHARPRTYINPPQSPNTTPRPPTH